MKKIIFTTFTNLLIASHVFAQPTVTNDVEALLRSMSLDEKIGQMMQITLDIITVPNSSPIRLDESRLREAIMTNMVGSILNTGVNHALTLDEWRYVNKTIEDMALTNTPHGVPVLYGIDSIHGATYVLGSTLFPQNLGMAATRNPDLMRRSAEISAAETRAVGLRWTFSPVLDVGRQPLWARFAETFGEDPTLASILGVATVRGFQGIDLLQPGDWIKMTFSGSLESSSGPPLLEDQIKDDGALVLPIIGSVNAAGKTTIELQKELSEKSQDSE